MSDIHNKNARMAVSVLTVVVAMIGLSFASVPLYRLFCQVTGFNGTTMLAAAPPSEDQIVDREITVLFDTRVDSGLPWDFKPERRKVTVKIGQQGLIAFKASNLSARPTAGTAVYNVSPPKMGQYFNKTQCFCFEEQVIGGGRTAEMPVMFFIDPAIVEDRQMDDITDVTLSYTYYPANSAALDRAIEAFGDAPRQ